MEKDSNSIIFISNQSEKGIMLMGMSGNELSLDENINIGNTVSTTVRHYDGKGGGPTDFGQGLISKKGVTSADVIQHIRINYFKIKEK